jgi:hypothetical protein
MAGQTTTYGTQFIGNHLFYASQPRPTNLYIGLATGTQAPSPSITLAELANPTNPVRELSTSLGYSRKLITFGPGSTNEPVRFTNSSNIDWNFTGDAPLISYAFICDAASGTAGNIYTYHIIDTPKDPANGEPVSIGAGGLIFFIG